MSARYAMPIVANAQQSFAALTRWERDGTPPRKSELAGWIGRAKVLQAKVKPNAGEQWILSRYRTAIAEVKATK